MTFHPGDHVVDAIDDFLHGLLSKQDAAYVTAHCETCPICAVAMAEGRQRLAAMQSVAGFEAPERLIRSTVDKVERLGDARRRRRRWFWRITIPAVAAGLLILAILNIYYANLTASTYDLRVLGQTQLLPGTEASMRTQLLHSGQPTAGAAVTIALEDPRAGRTVQLASFTTNAEGTGNPRYQLPDWPDGSYTLRVTARSGWDTQTVTETVAFQRAWRLMLSTDKPVYQPGQTIHLRSLALRQPDLKPVAGQEAVFSITDPNGNVIFKQNGVTSRYGLSSADCPLATEILEGSYTALCRIGQTESRATVEVKHYVLPKFKIELTLDRPFYAPGQRVQAAVKADYFFGKAVAGAAVELEARSTDVSRAPLAALASKTDSTGVASFSFVLPTALIGTENNSGGGGGDARILITAAVRDSAGQEQSRARPATVTTSPIHIEVIPESGQLVRGVANRIYVLTTYADGRPAPTQLAISGLTTPPTTNALGAAVFEMTPAAEQIQLTVQASDSRGLASQRTVALQCGTMDESFLVRTDKAVYAGGQTLRLQAMGGGNEPIFLDFIKDGQTLLTQTVEMTGGKGALAIDLPPDLFGTLEMVAYRYGPEGLPIRKTRILYVQAANQLQVHTTLDRSEYRPGEAAKLAFQITDAAGQPVPGALSLTAVDEAVFSVLDQAPGMEKTFFTLEQKLLAPIYAIYPWSPDLDSSQQDQLLLEQAVFAKAADQPGDRDAILQRLISAGQISPRMLKSLDTPYGRRALEEQLEYANFPAEQVAMLRNTGVHSLAHATGPENAERAKRVQRNRLEIFPILWVAAGFVVALLLAYGINGVPGLVRLIVVVALLGCIISVMLPSLGKARELADRSATSANVSGILKAMVVNAAEGSGRPGDETATAQPRLREFFPETLLWRPELITDDQGRAAMDLDMADSITTWRLSTSAVSAAGQLGASTTPIRVFQPFFVDVNAPVALTRRDEIALPVVVYNYLDKAQTVSLTLDTPSAGPLAWFDLLDEATKTLILQPAEVRSITFRVRATVIGRHDFQITARAGAVADAIKRTIDVVPDGRLVEQVVSGTLAGPADLTLTLPPEAIPGSVQASLKLYPSAFSQLVEGLDAVFQQPYGCFEQTSSTTYPNVLALAYLRQTKKTVPQVEATARQYIHLGYQRLMSFEISGGGFDWFGRPPANRTLTAYGLLEFQDMAKVHNVDPNLIQRTRQWLLSQRNADGSWSAESRGFYHEDPTSAAADARQVATTAYTAWAVFQEGQAKDAVGPTRTWLSSHLRSIETNPYALALVGNAFLAMDSKDPEARVIAGLLEGCKRSSADAKTCWWDQLPNYRTAFYGAGVGGNVETTALASLVLVGTGQNPGTARAALNWLITQKDPQGTWHSTQATVLALKAILAASGQPLGNEKPRQIAIRLGGQTAAQTITIPADQADVMQSLDLTPRLSPGNTQVALSDLTDTATTYQLRFQYYVPAPLPLKEPAAAGPLSISVDYDHADLAVGQTLSATATLRNNMATAVPMVIVDLPIPAGFAMSAEDLDVLRTAGTIAKYQITPRSAIVYLRDLPAGTPVVLQYHLKATMAVQLTAPSAIIYEYYNPENRGQSTAKTLRVQGM